MFALVWLGIIRALATPKTAISLLCLTGFALQIILHGLLHVYGLPHYYCGTWIITVLLAWLGADALSRHIAGRALVIAAGSSAAIVTCVLAIFLHLHAGSRTLGYGPNLAEQLNIARQMNRLAPADVPVQSDVETIQQFPQALQLLRQMDRTVRAGQNDVGGFRVDYRDDDPFDAHLRLEVVSLVTHQ